MLKKICRQREKIEKLAAKESDAAEKLQQIQTELAEERDALDEMEKEHLFSLMRERAMSLEETMALFEKGAEVLPEAEDADAAEPEELEEPKQEAEPDAENIFTEDAAEDFEQEPDMEQTDAPDGVAEADDEFFSGFSRRKAADGEGFWV